MKRTFIFSLCLLASWAFSQNHSTVNMPRDVEGTAPKAVKKSPQPESTTVIWSEDFANGIPTSWSNFGTPAAAQWEARCPNSTPSNAVGSRGAYAGTRGPINSSTASDCFVIFDSDYLDNNGVAGGFGTGVAPAPHIGILETGVIDLSNEPNVELKFETYLRRFSVRYYIAFSTDSGATFTDTIEAFPPADVPVNSESGNGVEATFNVSNIIGNEDGVVIQFIFDGITGNPGANGDSYYFWMIDDIEIRQVPDNELRFTSYNGAPPQDLIYRDTISDEGPYGIMHEDQIMPMRFDGNIFNYGNNAQTNVSLEVEILDESGAVVSTLSTPACANLAQGDTCTWQTLTTGWWTPSGPGEYRLVFKALSDSISSANATAADTIRQYVSESMFGMDRNILSNVTSSNLLAVAARYPMVNEDPDSANGSIYIDGVQTYISTTADSTADIEIAIYDTAGFPNSSPTLVASSVFTLSGADLGTVKTFDMRNNGQPLMLPKGTYFIQASFFPNATDGVVRIGNDASFDAGGTSLMLYNDGNWYGGFSNSNSYESPWLRVMIHNDTASSGVGLKDIGKNSFSVYPNPVVGISYLEFEMGGEYDITLYNMMGNAIKRTQARVNGNEKLPLNYYDLPAGVYLLNVQGEGVNKTLRLTVQ